MGFLSNRPNIAKHEIYFDTSGKKACNDYINFQGRQHSVAMLYVVHLGCGTRIRGLVWKADYNRFNRPGRRYRPGVKDNPIRILALYCPECKVRVGKATRRMLDHFGKLTGWHGPDRDSRPDIGRDEVGCNYCFPRGIELNADNSEIIGIDPEYVRCMEDDEDTPRNYSVCASEPE